MAYGVFVLLISEEKSLIRIGYNLLKFSHRNSIIIFRLGRKNLNKERQNFNRHLIVLNRPLIDL